jgi:UDP-N-acetyl-D-glucosamine dehydrogenase
MTKNIGIIGLGYVGLPLALRCAEAGFRVCGFDVDPTKVAGLNKGRSYIKHIGNRAIQQARKQGFVATADMGRVGEQDVLVICVPTPLNKHYEPDLSFVTSTVDAIVPHLRKGQLVSLESTTYPGTTDEEVRSRIEGRGLVVGKDVFVVYSPEREDPGNKQFPTRKIPKVVGGCTESCLKRGLQFYRAVVDEVVPVSSTRVAELAKLLENIHRAVNIGLVNELKTVATAMGIDIWEVIGAAATKPFGFTPFFPGPGLGGHCIPIDPFYLTWKAREYGVNTRFVELAGQINRSMPAFVVERTLLALNARGKAVRGSRILLLGLSYKADVDDIRESPTFDLLDRFAALGAKVAYHDPHVPEIWGTREHDSWQGAKSLPWTRQNLRAQDAVVIVTKHRSVDYRQLAQWAPLIVDTRNAMAGISGPAAVVKA